MESTHGQDSKNIAAGGVGFLVKEYLCEILKVINDTEFDNIAYGYGYQGGGEQKVSLTKHVYASRIEECDKICLLYTSPSPRD